ncbi:winged helix-turn-helix domain-containing protein [Pedobacter psychroterrae]|uniref:Winged helix-turn-helix domain-containing protein n=1 Tax=Pedobacter psychroterrae TaxID=2530453 RepID=A0A4R0N9G6_9SPHI|nr:crosslink repair DNA glycosylase YcaQ family protein [Pedobacter psychroterrae]TCC96849.1 winged helix-turn-helix domain-containing protein [Pedobacter psychroterrae]
MAQLNLSRSQARKIILDAAGLSAPAQFGYGIEAVYKLIDHLGFVQLDTNYVVERAHHHVMFSRVPDYEISWLSELCEDGRVFEYLTSDAGFLPMNDFRFSLPIKKAFELREKPSDKRMENLMRQILDQVERDGVVMVGDFENDRVEASTGWWDWRPAKVALERLYLEGKLMVSRDRKFHRRYDVPLNLIPQEIDLSMPSAEEFARVTIGRTLGALGICSVKEMTWRSRRVKGNLVKSELEKMVVEEEVILVNVDGMKGPHYMLAGQKIDVEISGDVFILSPFDILNVFRHRLKDFFGFDYQIECFVPAPKRIYGYFSLPVLAGDVFIARMDSKADRKNKVLLVHNIHFEDVELSKEILEKFIAALMAFVAFNHCYDIRFDKTNKPAYLKAIVKGFS